MKNCAHCTAEFAPINKRAIYCGSLCKSRAYNAARKADGRGKAEREKNRDYRAAWMRENAHRYKGKYSYTKECPCGATFTTSEPRTQHCSQTCGRQIRKGYCTLPPRHPVRKLNAEHWASVDQRSPLRRAIEDGSLAETMAALLERCTIEGECWIWQGASKDGYPMLSGRKRPLPLHRLVAAKRHGPLGKQPVHHVCANTLCLNPEHLQPVTHRENNAEMLARNYLLTRIADLEAALAQHEPTHALLLEVGVPKPQLAAA